jgi:putative DNA primase/helicase
VTQDEISQITGVDTPEARAERARSALLEVLAAEDVLGAARGRVEHEALAGIVDCVVELERLRAVRGAGKLVTSIERASRAARQRTQLRVVGQEERAELRAAIGAPEGWPEYQVPAEYEASPRGIVRLDRVGKQVIPVPVAEAPIAVVGVRVDVGTGHESVVLGYRRHGAWRRLAVPREQARDSKGLIELAGQGVPVSSATSRELVRWLTACEDQGGRDLPRERCTTRTGWHDDTYIQGPGGEIELEDADDSRTGWRTSGTWEGWLEALDIIEGERAPWIVLYAASAAPLLRWLTLGHNPIIDLWGPKGRGKTTCLRLAGSVMGRPDDGQGGTILTWDSSPTSIERMAARTWDAPLLLDDTKRARRPQDVTSALYSLAQGRGRGRGTPGGVQKTSTWRTVVVSTGEAPLVEATEAGGARARVLSLGITPAISDLRTAKRLEAVIAAHHGHLGARIAARALELGPELRKRYEVALAKWAAEIPGDTRLLSTCAVLEVAHDVGREIGLPEPERDWRECLVQALQESIVAGDQAERGLDLVRAELAMNGARYRGRAPRDRHTGEEIDPASYRGIWREQDEWVGIYPPILRELLEGHDMTTLVVQWLERGVLVRTPGRNTLDVGLRKGEKHRVYAFRRDDVLG